MDVRTKLTSAMRVVLVGAVASLAAGCGEFIRQDRAPVTLVITSLVAGEDAASTLRSDVRTAGSILDDMGSVSMQLILKDPGAPGVTNVPSPINEVTISRYRVSFRRTDGRNTPGVDVPFPFESAATFRVPASGTVSASFELIRHTAKLEAPLAGLAGSFVIISTIADITFTGRDQAGNQASVTGSMGILFGDFADPE